MKRIVYDGPYDEVEIAATGQLAKRGEPVEVEDELAGQAPSGEPGADGYDPGAGLLAQDCWKVAAAERPAKPEKKPEGSDA